MKFTLRRVLILLLALIFLGSSGIFLLQLRDQQAAKKAYALAQEIAVGTPPPAEPSPEPPTSEEAPPEEELPFLLDLDLNALRETNKDVLGWVHIPDSPISYPLMEADDNQEYLRRAWDGSYNSAGCIFLECENQPDLSDFNTMIYGHYMRNGTMFGSLHEYKEQAYWDAHPYVYLVTDEGIHRYQVFSVYEAKVVSDTYRLRFENDEEKQTALEHYITSSLREAPLLPTIHDRILTLSTCTGTGSYRTRWVVQAVWVETLPRSSVS